MTHRIARRAPLASALATPALARARSGWSATRPVRVIAPYTAGGASDIMARLIADRLRGTLAQAGVVENRAGASGIIGTDAVANPTRC